jgi:hypothetical protein
VVCPPLIEVTFQEARAHLGIETQRQWSKRAIARTTPILLGLFSLLTLMADRLVSCQASTHQRLVSNNTTDLQRCVGTSATPLWVCPGFCPVAGASRRCKTPQPLDGPVCGTALLCSLMGKVELKSSRLSLLARLLAENM